MATEAAQEARTGILSLDLPEEVWKDVLEACAITGIEPEEFARKAILRLVRQARPFLAEAQLQKDLGQA